MAQRTPSFACSEKAFLTFTDHGPLGATKKTFRFLNDSSRTPCVERRNTRGRQIKHAELNPMKTNHPFMSTRTHSVTVPPVAAAGLGLTPNRTDRTHHPENALRSRFQHSYWRFLLALG